MAIQGSPGGDSTTFCRACGRPIEADARFCRFCGKAQNERTPSTAAPPPATSRPRSSANPVRSGGAADGLERRLRQLFPRHNLQDEFMHIGTIAAFFMALIGFVLGFFPAYNWLADNFLFGAIALLLFLILRESTLSHIRARGGADAGPSTAGGRYQAGRQPAAGSELPPEAATTQSTPPRQAPAAPPSRPPASPRQ